MQTLVSKAHELDLNAEECLSPDEIAALDEECEEWLHNLETSLVSLVRTKTDASPELALSLFRWLHNVRCAAAYLRCDALGHLASAAESVLSNFRDGKVTLNPKHAEALLSATYRMDQLIDDHRERPDAEIPKSSYKVELDAVLSIIDKEELPARNSAAEIDAASPEPTAQPRRLKVLVVEDDFSSRVVLQGLLSQYGDCHVAVNGKEAVDAFRLARQNGKGYDLICMDIRMPEMYGTEAVRQIREIEHTDSIRQSGNVRIFMTTGIRGIQAVAASYKALCDAYLFKPIDGEKLREHLRAFGLSAEQLAASRS